ncbi:uncharacterized protein LOC141900490 [Tubulanus polymorphus]|uniref:uncharacterized protein LOC141900490 n=1 Tax=Tubulanus polymorphus TaxID=672921 RepID=UPI003DA2CF00
MVRALSLRVFEITAGCLISIAIAYLIPWGLWLAWQKPSDVLKRNGITPYLLQTSCSIQSVPRSDVITDNVLSFTFYNASRNLATDIDDFNDVDKFEQARLLSSAVCNQFVLENWVACWPAGECLLTPKTVQNIDKMVDVWLNPESQAALCDIIDGADFSSPMNSNIQKRNLQKSIFDSAVSLCILLKAKQISRPCLANILYMQHAEHAYEAQASYLSPQSLCGYKKYGLTCHYEGCRSMYEKMMCMGDVCGHHMFHRFPRWKWFFDYRYHFSDKCQLSNEKCQQSRYVTHVQPQSEWHQIYRTFNDHAFFVAIILFCFAILSFCAALQTEYKRAAIENTSDNRDYSCIKPSIIVHLAPHSEKK